MFFNVTKDCQIFAGLFLFSWYLLFASKVFHIINTVQFVYNGPKGVGWFGSLYSEFVSHIKIHALSWKYSSKKDSKLWIVYFLKPNMFYLCVTQFVALIGEFRSWEKFANMGHFVNYTNNRQIRIYYFIKFHEILPVAVCLCP